LDVLCGALGFNFRARMLPSRSNAVFLPAVDVVVRLSQATPLRNGAGTQLAGLPAPALVVVDGEAEITALAQDLWPGTPIQRCWWHLPHGLRNACYADDAANRHVNPRWASTRASSSASCCAR